MWHSTGSLITVIIRIKCGRGRAHQLGAPSFYSQNPHGDSELPATLVLVHPTLSGDIQGYLPVCMMCTYMHAGITFIHIKKFKQSFSKSKLKKLYTVSWFLVI